MIEEQDWYAELDDTRTSGNYDATLRLVILITSGFASKSLVILIWL